jgi:hypothetical protein
MARQGGETVKMKVAPLVLCVGLAGTMLATPAFAQTPNAEFMGKVLVLQLKELCIDTGGDVKDANIKAEQLGFRKRTFANAIAMTIVWEAQRADKSTLGISGGHTRQGATGSRKKEDLMSWSECTITAKPRVDDAIQQVQTVMGLPRAPSKATRVTFYFRYEAGEKVTYIPDLAIGEPDWPTIRAAAKEGVGRAIEVSLFKDGTALTYQVIDAEYKEKG